MFHWRNTFKPARFFVVDARAAIPLLFFLLHIRMWTLVIALGVMAFFWWLERVGMDTNSAFRSFRCFMGGDKRPPLPDWKIRGRVDYGRPQSWNTIKDVSSFPLKVSHFLKAGNTEPEKVKFLEVTTEGYLMVGDKIVRAGSVVPFALVKTGKVRFHPYEVAVGSPKASFKFSAFDGHTWSDPRESRFPSGADKGTPVANAAEEESGFDQAESPSFLKKHAFNIAVGVMLLLAGAAGYVVLGL